MDRDDYTDRLLDRDALASFLRAEVGPADEFAVERHERGNSNETLFVTWGDRELVLRRPPPGETPGSAHDVLREHRSLDGLAGVARPPTPEPVVACRDESVLGTEFYLMERVHGDVLDHEPDRFAHPDARSAVGEATVDALAALHGTDPAAVGLDDVGHPEGFVQRQIDVRERQLDWVREHADHDLLDPRYDRLHAWLDDNVPESPPHAFVHGDYRLDNVMFAPGDEPRVAALLDWEQSTRGDPLLDLAHLLIHWRDDGDPAPAMPEWDSLFTDRDGYPTRRDLVTRYEAATGVAFENRRFYRALELFKGAVAGEVLYARYQRGETIDPLYGRMDDRVPAMLDRVERVVAGDEPL
jgi:aminoglycoside phosphotransferase (APT) family kinase protein